jgi:amino acid transporter
MSLKSSSMIGLFPLILLITGAIDSIRNLPGAALFGSTIVFFFVISALIFLIPVAFIAAELSAVWSEEEGGVYSWVKHAFGEKWAFITIWLQWVNTMVWYPSVISFIAGTAAYFIDPELANHKGYIVSIIVIVFWSMTGVSLRGVGTSARFAAACAIIGMIIPMALIVVLGIIWIVQGEPLQIHFTWSNMIPNFHHNQNWISLTAIMTAFLGMELAAVHVTHVKDPKKNFPRGIFYSVGLILLTMILGTLAIAFVLPQEKINLVSGTMQAFSSFFEVYHLSWMVPVITVMLLIGSLGGMINWIISPAKGLLMAAEQGYMPAFFAKRNKQGVASNLMIIQAILVTVLCSAFLLIPSVNGIYWLLTALSTQLYMVMYVLMFLAGLKIKKAYPERLRSFTVPGGNLGYKVTSYLGLFGCIITLIVGFIPPEILDIGGAFRYEMTFCLGFVGLLLPSIFFYNYRRKLQKREKC